MWRLTHLVTHFVLFLFGNENDRGFRSQNVILPFDVMSK